jgi:hypothetical protein
MLGYVNAHIVFLDHIQSRRASNTHVSAPRQWANARIPHEDLHNVQGMRNILDSFIRGADGKWRCVTPADLQLPEGRVQVVPGLVLESGRRFMNVDLAKLLDEQYEQDPRR